MPPTLVLAEDGKKGRLWSAALAIHGEGSGVRIANAVIRIGRDSSIEVGGKRKKHQHGERDLERRAEALLFPGIGNQRGHAQEGGGNVSPKSPAMFANVAGGDQINGGQECEQEEGEGG